MTCKYKTTFYDYNKEKKVPFECENTALDSGYCKFHDENYLKESTFDELIILIKDQLKNGSPKCIGYRIPIINFNEIYLQNIVYFNKAQFFGNVNFSKKYNSSKIIFKECEFHEQVNFSNSVHDEEMDFSFTKFYNDVKFTSANFNDKITFESAEFKANTNFQSTIFKKKVIFQKTEFQHVDFDLAIFYQDTDFYDVKFFNSSSFWNVKFLGKTTFSRAKFTENADFHESEFKEGVFQDTNFEKGGNYENCLIHSLNFQNTISNDFTIFRNVRFSKPENVTLNMDLTQFSFLFTDLTRINFGDKVMWNNNERKKESLQIFQKRNENNNRFKIYDERELEHNLTYSTLEAVQSVYRRLRENFDYNLRYDDAGQFFVREMELKRKFYEKHDNSKITVHKKILLHVFSLLGIYYGLSKYGESLLRPTILALIIISVGSGVFWSEELAFYHEEPDQYEGRPIEKAVVRSVTSFFPFYSLDENTGIDDLIFKIVLLPTSALIFISLRRKLERRFRH